MRYLLLWLGLVFVTPANAQTVEALSDAGQNYVEGNVLAILYHELGHALIDLLQPPVLGQEEDAADVLSVVLTHDLWQEAEARNVASASAMAFWLSSLEETETSYWDVHGPDQQRYYNLVCLFYGADPKGRADFAREFELPDDRAGLCPDEFALADESWGALLDEIAVKEGAPAGTSLGFQQVEGDDAVAALLQQEISDLNERYSLPEPIEVRQESCGEVNAFYYSETRSISICTEYIDYLVKQAVDAEL